MDAAVLDFLTKVTGPDVTGLLVVAIDSRMNAVSKLVTSSKDSYQLYPIIIGILEDLVNELKTGGVTDKKQLNAPWGWRPW